MESSPSETPPPLSNASKSSQETQFLQTQITILKTGDDMDIMSTLINLSEHLSLSSDQIADNPNMPTLLEEISKQLDKTYIIELILYALNCINYILDLNPAFTSTLKKTNTVPKLILLISSMEDFTCLESIIKIFEKVSFENPHLLLENNALCCLLNIIDFLSVSQRKSLMKASLNMVMNISSRQNFLLFIKPCFGNIAMLTAYNENDMETMRSAILMLYYVITKIKENGYLKDDVPLEKEILKYSFLENLSEILQIYIMNENDNKKIGSDLVKRILLIMQNITYISNESIDKLMKIKFLCVLMKMINKEFEANSNVNSGDNSVSFEKGQVSFLTEIFGFITNLFPNIDTTKNEKILSDINKEEYKYLCDSIIKTIVNNILNKSSCSTLSLVLKMLIRFSQNADKEVIVNSMESRALAQIISKLLDTKYIPYVKDILTLLHIIMEKAAENYIVNFIREGIVEGIKTFTIPVSQGGKVDEKDEEINEIKIELKEEDNRIFKTNQ